MTEPEPMKREPAAQYRQAAAVWRQLYIALVDEGFTEEEAFRLLGQAIAAASRSRPDD